MYYETNIMKVDRSIKELALWTNNQSNQMNMKEGILLKANLYAFFKCLWLPQLLWNSPHLRNSLMYEGGNFFKSSNFWRAYHGYKPPTLLQNSRGKYLQFLFTQQALSRDKEYVKFFSKASHFFLSTKNANITQL